MIRNIFCVGRNYRLHAAELGNDVPGSPMIFMKPTHAAVPMDGADIAMTGKYGLVHYEAELVIRIGRVYKPGMKTAELVDGFALGIDFTLRELQEELKQKQHPWLKAKGFAASAPITPFQNLGVQGVEELSTKEFSLRVNGEERQRGHISEMIFDFQDLIDAIGEHYGLDEGDIIFTGTPAGVAQINDGDHLELFWGESRLGHCTVMIK
jgi:fumarylpyruvate hydrolase